MTVKTDFSRFDIHDELTAPEGSERMLKSISETGGSVSKLVGVLAGAPRALRAFARLRSELQQGALPKETADPDRPGRRREARRRLQRRPARPLGPSLGTRARRDLARPELRLERRARGAPARASSRRRWTPTATRQHYLLEEAREVDWTDEQMLEALGRSSR